MYRRDFKFLDLKWQDVTQLFNRHAGKWLTLAIILIALVVGGSLGQAHFYSEHYSKMFCWQMFCLQY